MEESPSTVLSMDIKLPCEVSLISIPKTGRKSAKRVDAIWGAWFFYSFYFEAAVKKGKLEQSVFMVQHDMENMYMWVFKDRPENALGKMQLRSFMNGHSRQGEPAFPFTPDKGFVRSHRMQRKHYRGLSNPQCLHGVQLVPSPVLPDHDRARWLHLTGRGSDFTIPPEASDFVSWRTLTLPSDFRLHTPPPSISLHPNPAPPTWLNHFTGAMKNVFGPVTAAKTIYEDDHSYLIIISLPCVDLHRVKVSWRNTLTHGIIKVSGVSTARVPFLKRRDRVFRLADPSSEHCPPGEFVREIPLSTRILEDANIEAYYDSPGSLLEIVVPKLRSEPEEHEIRVCFRPHLGLT